MCCQAGLTNQMKKGGRMNRLKEYRVNRNITQEDLSKKSGISRTTIVNIENGNLKFIRSDTMNALSKALNVPVSTLFF